MIEKFSLEAQKIISYAEALAFEFHHSMCGIEHLFLSFLKKEDSLYTEEFLRFNISYEKIASLCKKIYPQSKKEVAYCEYTIDLKEVMCRSKQISEKRKEKNISAYSLFSSLLENKSFTNDILDQYKIEKTTILANIAKKGYKKSELDNIIDLHLLGKGNIDPLIGREKEMELLISSLSRRNKPNAILIGEPGVGKTAIVEELGKRLLDNKIPSLSGKRIYELDIPSTVSGTKYRGEFEDKIKRIIKKTKEDGNAILFVDEIHTIVKAGGAEGAIDCANILKPYLARGEIQLIGATTEEEFSSSFEKDKALKRRFQLININEPTFEETKAILLKIKSLYERHYSLIIEDEVVYYILEKTKNNFLNEKYPDKAIDLLDNSCVLALKTLKKEDVDKTINNFYYLNDFGTRIEKLKEKLNEKIEGQDEAIKDIISFFKTCKKHEENNISLGSLLLKGPSGVGKTYTAKLISKTLFLENESIRIDLSTYNDFGSLARLIGLNNYDSFSPFVKQIKNKPQSLVIFDSYEKASSEIKSFLNEMLDNSYFYDSKGNKINTSKCIFIFILNNQELSFSMQNGYKTNNNIEYQFEDKFTQIALFSPLTKDNLLNLLKKGNNEINLDMESGNLELLISSISNKELLSLGARSIKRKKYSAKN